MKRTLTRQRIWLGPLKRRSAANIFFAGLAGGGPPSNPPPPVNSDFYILRSKQRPLYQRLQLLTVRPRKRHRNKTALYQHFAATKVLVAVPGVVGIAIESAMSVLANAGLVSSETFEGSLSVPAGIVISQNPTADMPPVLVGSTVVLLVSTGWVLVPNVDNLLVGAAVAAIIAAGLIPKINEVPVLGLPAGTVIDQQPPPEARALAGNVVTIVISKLPPPGTVRAQLPPMSDLVAVQVNLQ